MANTIEIFVDFIENHLPGLKSGDYRIKGEQSFQATDNMTEVTFSSQEKDFSIRGERFTLKPTDIASVYPPPNSLGEHSNVLPQVVFERNTLPWERMIAEPKDGTDKKRVEKMPWMALLVFNEDQLTSFPGSTPGNVEQGTVITLSQFRTQMGGQYPKPESDEKNSDKLSVIYIKKSVLEGLLPSATELTHLCHARESTLRLHLQNAPVGDKLFYEIKNKEKKVRINAGYVPVIKGKANQQVILHPGQLKAGDYEISILEGENRSKVEPTLTITPNDEFGHRVAVVVANRLPKPGARSIVHLVSLEERYKWDSAQSQYRFDFGEAKDEDVIPLVTLKTWQFNCVTETHNFDQLLKSLITKGKGDTDNTLRLPQRPNPNQDTKIDNANHFLKNGYVPLSHRFRRGGKSVSWYRSPLMPGQKPKSSLKAHALPASCADSLLLYDEQYGMFDVSYAAAWELGRLLALKNKGVSVSLYRWKKLHRNKLLLAEQQELHSHLPFQHDASQAIAMPKDIEDWFSALSRLQGLPFNYLVPDEQMLPMESIRFFRLDQEWISCLIDGAFSVGRVTTEDTAADRALHQQQIAQDKPPVISGFLLRSYVVKGWPKLQVDGYYKVSNSEEEMDGFKLKPLRIDRLSPNVLLCLFERKDEGEGKDDLKAVDIHQKPEMLHLGFDPVTSDHYTKNLRNAKGKDKDDNDQPFATITLTTANWNAETRIVKVEELFSNIKGKTELKFEGEFTSAQFALSMVEGVQKVRFIRS